MQHRPCGAGQVHAESAERGRAFWDQPLSV